MAPQHSPASNSARNPDGVAPPDHRDAAPVRRALSIAGSDSGGGAGIQADLKAFARVGVHGMTAITAITAQNTRTVTAVEAVPGPMIVEQVRAVVDDIGVDAVKIGMLGTAAIAAAVGEALDLLPPGTPIVLDPVMVAESGAELLDVSARTALTRDLLPRVTVVTPNLPEAHVLAGVSGESGAGGPQAPDDDEHADPVALARAVHALGPEIVVVTGGHRDVATDILFDGERTIEIPGQRHPDGAAHGSGCTHSSALAAGLARGLDPVAAARLARAIAGEAVRNGLRGLGDGAGPVDALDIRAAAREATRG